MNIEQIVPSNLEGKFSINFTFCHSHFKVKKKKKKTNPLKIKECIYVSNEKKRNIYNENLVQLLLI